MSLEQVVRPYQGEDVTPVRVTTPGVAGAAPVRLSIGLRGGTKIFAYSGSGTVSTKMGEVHKESAPNSAALQLKLTEASI